MSRQNRKKDASIKLRKNYSISQLSYFRILFFLSSFFFYRARSSSAFFSRVSISSSSPTTSDEAASPPFTRLLHQRFIRTCVPVLHTVATIIPKAPIHVDNINLVSSIVPGSNINLAIGFNIVNGTPIRINIINGMCPPLLLRLMNLICNTISTIVIASDICMCGCESLVMDWSL